MTRRKLTCHGCRSRKVRCDGKQPACARCIHADRSCSYVKRRQFAFRHSALSSRAAEDARERSRQSIDVHQSSSPNQEDSEHPSQGLFSPTSLGNSSSGLSPFVPLSPRATGAQRKTHDGLDATFSANTEVISQVEPETPLGSATNLSDQSIHLAARPQRELQDSLTPLEGELLQFFVCHIGPWLDVTSPQRHYTHTVPILSRQSPVLLYAIMACAAHIMRLLSKSTRPELGSAEARCQNRCLELLIPLLDNQDAVFQDEVILATIAVLRMSEQYDEFQIDRQFHLVPQAFDHFQATGPSSTRLGGLREATFYSYVRADIRMAILGRCGTRLEMDKWPLDTTLEHDVDWANQMTYYLVQAVNLCLRSGAPGIWSKEVLLQRVDEWKNKLPTSFSPYYHQEESDDEPFPVIRLLCPWHAVGLQFYHTAKILLATTSSHEGGGSFTDMLRLNKHISTNVLSHARVLCGISFSNEHHGCRINSSHLIALGAQFFNGRKEQLRVLDYFYRLEEQTAWPSHECLKMLEEAYGIRQSSDDYA